MSATSSKPSIREWLPRLISGQPHMIIGGDNNPYMLRWWRPLVFRPAKWRHRVELIRSEQREIPCWTLIVTGPRQRVWGFWCKDTLLAMSGRHVPSERFVPWTEFGDAGCGEIA